MPLVSSLIVFFFFKVFKFWWPPNVIKELFFSIFALLQLDTPWVFAVIGHGVLDSNFSAPGQKQTGAMEGSGMSVFSMLYRDVTTSSLTPCASCYLPISLNAQISIPFNVLDYFSKLVC